MQISKSNRIWRILSASDIHMGHNKVKVPAIVDNMRAYYFPYISQCDLLILGGDFFDRMLAFGDVYSNMILSFISELLFLADQHKVVVRVLRGTFSHDRTQCSVFETQYKDGKFTNDFKYVDVMSCEYIESLEMKVLYFPDDLPYKSVGECMDVIKEMLKKMSWAKFDYVFGHGCFHHMFPDNVPMSGRPAVTFHVNDFRGLVSRYVVMGHIHYSDITEFVIYNGSFERLAHGEEEKKGFIYIADDGKDAKIQFIENKSARKFLTLDLVGKTMEASVSAFKALADKYRSENVVHIRIIHESAEVRTLLQKYCRQNYRNVDFTVKSMKADKREQLRSRHLSELSSAQMPTPDNLSMLVYEFMTSTHGEHALSLERIAETLSSL